MTVRREAITQLETDECQPPQEARPADAGRVHPAIAPVVTRAAAGPASSTAPTSSPGPEKREPTIKEVIAAWYPRLEEVWEAWTATLPPEAATEWRVGAAYVRESSVASLGGDAPDVQLRNTLALLARKQVYVPRRGLFFDVQSGTDVSTRPAFQRLFHEALAGGFKVIGVFVSERLFRNMEQSAQYKRTFAQHGIELEYTGKFEGDRRSPSAWQLEVMTDMAAELHARNTGYYLGRHFELISRQGRPVGSIPEVYRVVERAPSFMGRGGGPIRWELTEPLASTLREGAQRFLDGAGFLDLAVWSAAGPLKGRTPKGREMNKDWWRNSLRNPVHAGYTVPTEYTGFRPGKISAPRRRRTAGSELVPSALPALWPLETYQRILAVASDRYHAPRNRVTYHKYLISGLAFDPACGHQMRVLLRGERGKFFLACRREDGTKNHGSLIRGDVAQAELDALIGRMVLDDPVLIALIEEELAAITQTEGLALERFVPDPAIGKVRAALTALGPSGMDEIRAGLSAKLDALLAIDEGRRQAVSRPVAEFHSAIEELRRWKEAWARADDLLKNKWLRAAGIRVTVGRDKGQKPRTPGHILSIESSNPVFHLALRAALEAMRVPSDGSQSCGTENGFVRLRGGNWAATSDTPARVSVDLVIKRPVVAVSPQLNEAPTSPRAGYVSTTEYGRRAGLRPDVVWRLVKQGRLNGFTVTIGKRRWVYVLESAAPAPLDTEPEDFAEAA